MKTEYLSIAADDGPEAKVAPVNTETGPAMKPSNSTRDAESLERHFKPRLQQLLRALGVDVAYERGQGNHLYHRDDQGREIEVLDLVGGYGSLLLGHAHPALVAEAQRLLATGRPVHAQGSRREYAARLACELSRRVSGDYCVVFGNSGTEAVEAAMKHALIETGGRTFIALEGAFHGKTLGALQLTAHPDYRESFELPEPGVVRVAPDSIEQLETAFERVKHPAGFVFEPILGEGGVRPLDAAFVQRAARLCAEHRIPLIADECQTGLGRTGRFLACDALAVRPDSIVLSKALGGGLAKISAVLIRRERYVDTFDLRHTSTFAEDDFSCALALKTLELIDEPLIAACEERGGELIAGLRRLAARHPEVIAGVRGRGLMIGLEFRRLTSSRSFLLRFLTAQEDLVWMVMGYLLNVHRVRVAPTLSERFTLRLEPSAMIGKFEIQQTLAALEDVCARLGRGDAPGLTAFLPPGGTPRTASGNRLARPDARFAAHDEPGFRRRRLTTPSVTSWWEGPGAFISFGRFGSSRATNPT
jgi:acetylornithine/succinyldiaminopimelate/putrescine aminotransferase